MCLCSNCLTSEVSILLKRNISGVGDLEYRRWAKWMISILYSNFCAKLIPYCKQPYCKQPLREEDANRTWFCRVEICHYTRYDVFHRHTKCDFSRTAKTAADFWKIGKFLLTHCRSNDMREEKKKEISSRTKNKLFTAGFNSWTATASSSLVAIRRKRSADLIFLARFPSFLLFFFFLLAASHSCGVTPREPRFASRSDTFRICLMLILNFLAQWRYFSKWPRIRGALTLRRADNPRTMP